MDRKQTIEKLPSDSRLYLRQARRWYPRKIIRGAFRLILRMRRHQELIFGQCRFWAPKELVPAATEAMNLLQQHDKALFEKASSRDLILFLSPDNSHVLNLTLGIFSIDKAYAEFKSAGLLSMIVYINFNFEAIPGAAFRTAMWLKKNGYSSRLIKPFLKMGDNESEKDEIG